MIIAVDFDGTVVDHDFPRVGQDVPGAVVALSALVSRGHALVLWTMRSGEYLDAAVQWYASRGIPLHGVNTNPDQASWTTSPKAFADVYVDDCAAGAPLVTVPGFNRPVIDWDAVWRAIGSASGSHPYPLLAWQCRWLSSDDAEWASMCAGIIGCPNDRARSYTFCPHCGRRIKFERVASDSASLKQWYQDLIDSMGIPRSLLVSGQ